MKDQDFRWSRDGTISAREFHASARALAERWKRSNPESPPWTWVSSAPQHLGLVRSSDQINGFLTLEKLCHSELTRNDITSSEESLHGVTQETTSSSEEVEPIDNATLVENAQGIEIVYFDFHIVYSASFRVPILYFRAYRIDGELVGLDEIAKELPSSSAKMLVESKWTFITQEEHPYLKRPWYKLHPCGTSEWIKLLFQSDSSSSLGINKGVPIQELYLVSWLSLVGQVVGLRIPSEMINLHY